MPTEDRLGGWRALWWQLHDYGGDAWADDVLVPWIETHPARVSELRQVAGPQGPSLRLHNSPEAWDLYALGRVLDVLVSPFQPERHDPAILDWVRGGPWWSGRIPSTDAIFKFGEALGARRTPPISFHPFFHEIVEVVESEDPHEEPVILSEVWPGYVFDHLLLLRAGVRLRAGNKSMKADTASHSTLYWAWWRRNRPAADLSHGWGGNSQWGTDARRDYWIGNQLIYNAEYGDGPPGWWLQSRRLHDDPEPDPEVMQMLLRHRCSLHDDVGRDAWPYFQHAVEPFAEAN